MNNVVSWISIGLWIVYGLLFIYREVLRNKGLKNNNIFHLIRFDTILFLAIYIFYQYYADNIKFFYLYLALIITSIVYIIYDIVDNYGRNNNKGSFLYYFIFIIIATILCFYYAITHNYLLVTTITLVINIFIPLYVWGFIKIKHST